MRKEADFNVVDHILVYAKGNDRVETVMRNNLAAIQNDVLADQVVFGKTEGYMKEWDINGEKAEFGVKKIEG